MSLMSVTGLSTFLYFTHSFTSLGFNFSENKGFEGFFLYCSGICYIDELYWRSRIKEAKKQVLLLQWTGVVKSSYVLP